MINVIKNLLHEDIAFLTPIIALNFLVVLNEITLVLVNDPPFTIPPVLDVINHRTDHLLNNELIDIKAEQITLKSQHTFQFYLQTHSQSYSRISFIIS